MQEKLPTPPQGLIGNKNMQGLCEKRSTARDENKIKTNENKTVLEQENHFVCSATPFKPKKFNPQIPV